MIQFLLKGLIRDKSRSFFPVLIVAAGVFLTVALYSFMNGMLTDMISVSAKFDAGYVKVMTRSYWELADQIPNDLSLTGTDALLDSLKKYAPGMAWSPRIRFGGLLDIPDSNGETKVQGPVMGMAVNLLDSASTELDILRLRRSIVEGRLPSKPNEILISQTFAKKLNAKVGDVATLLGSTMYGGMAVYNFRISGMIRFGILAMDRAFIIADIKDARLALDMENGASEIVGFTKNMIYDDKRMNALADNFNSRFSNQADEFSPIMVPLGRQGNLTELLQVSKTVGGILVSVFVFAMSLVLWNSGLMNHLRRYGEIGIRLAMGEPKGRLYRLMIAESFFIGLVGSVLGTLLGLGLSCFLQEYGFDFSRIMQKSTLLMNNEIRAQITSLSFVIGFLPGLFAPVLGSIVSGIGIYKRQTSQLFKELEA